MDRLLSADLAAAAAVAVEDLTPPSEKRYWENPRHSTFMASESHSADTPTVLRAVMLGRALLLAVKAPHDLIMLGMTLTLPTIYFNPDYVTAGNGLSHGDSSQHSNLFPPQRGKGERRWLGSASLPGVVWKRSAWSASAMFYDCPRLTGY